MSGKIRHYGILTLLAISTSFQAAYAGCLTTKQIEADQIKFVQASLTAAAYVCRGNRRDQILKIYDYYISQYRNELLSGLDNLHHYYQDEAGVSSATALDRHITTQVNYVRAIGQDNRNFCKELSEKALQLMISSDRSLDDWVEGLPISYYPVVKACAISSYTQLAVG